MQAHSVTPQKTWTSGNTAVSSSTSPKPCLCTEWYTTLCGEDTKLTNVGIRSNYKAYYCGIKRRQRCFNCRHYTEGIRKENYHKWQKPWWDKAVTLKTLNPSIWTDKHRISCNDSSDYRQRHVHHVIICQIDSALKHQCCGWEEKHLKYRRVTVQGPRQEITYCPET